MQDDLDRTVIVHLRAMRESERFWVRLQLLEGLDEDASRFTATAKSVAETCEIIRAWILPLEDSGAGR
ncbi:MAG: hypothetical protein ABI939_07355 [Anaerolineaceae bacterium]